MLRYTAWMVRGAGTGPGRARGLLINAFRLGESFDMLRFAAFSVVPARVCSPSANGAGEVVREVPRVNKMNEARLQK